MKIFYKCQIMLLFILFCTKQLLANDVYQLPNAFSGDMITYALSTTELFNKQDIDIKNILISCSCIKIDNRKDKILLNYNTENLVGNFKYTLSIFYQIKNDKQSNSVLKKVIYLKSLVKNSIKITPSKIIINPITNEKKNYFEINLESASAVPFSILDIKVNGNNVIFNYSKEKSSKHLVHGAILNSDTILLNNFIEISIDKENQKETLYLPIEKLKIVEPDYLIFNGIEYNKEYLKQLNFYNLEKINNLELISPSKIFKLIKLNGKYNISMFLKKAQYNSIIKGNLSLKYNQKIIQLPYIIFPKTELELNKKKQTKNKKLPKAKDKVQSGILVSNLNPSFETILQGHKVIIQETIKNTSNEEYDLRVRATCSSCGFANLDKNILNPNETSILTVKIISSSPENYKKDVWIYEKNGKIKPVKITISGIIKKAYEIDEKWLNNDFIEINITGLNVFDKAIIAKDVICYSKYFTLDTFKFSHSNQGKFNARIILKLKKDIFSSTIIDWVTIKFDNILTLNHKVERNVL